LDSASWKKWEGTVPSDEQYRGAYMEEESPLNDIWAELIFARRLRADIEESAKSGCFRSAIELDHLDSNKESPDGDNDPNLPQFRE